MRLMGMLWQSKETKLEHLSAQPGFGLIIAFVIGIYVNLNLLTASSKLLVNRDGTK